MVFLSLFLIFELTGYSDEFHVVFKHFQNLENLYVEHFKGQKLHISCPVSFKIAQCKQPRLVKP